MANTFLMRDNEVALFTVPMSNNIAPPTYFPDKDKKALSFHLGCHEDEEDQLCSRYVVGPMFGNGNTFCPQFQHIDQEKVMKIDDNLFIIEWSDEFNIRVDYWIPIDATLSDPRIQACDQWKQTLNKIFNSQW